MSTKNLMLWLFMINFVTLPCQVFSTDCRMVGDTAHHMIPNASLKDLPNKLNSFVYGADPAMAQKAAAIKGAILIASSKKNYDWAKAADTQSPLKGSVELLNKLPDRADSNFNMFPMNLVHGPKAECRTDDVHLGNALDALVISGPYANSLCGNALREIGTGILAFLKTSDNKNLEQLFEMVKKHAKVLFKYGRDKQRFSLEMWSFAPESAQHQTDATVKRYRAVAETDAPTKILTGVTGVTSSRSFAIPSKCWLPVKQGTDSSIQDEKIDILF